MTLPDQRVQFDSSTGEALFDSVSGCLIVHGCFNSVTIRFTGVNECAAPLNLWPSDINGQDFIIPHLPIIGGNCFYQGDVLDGDWHVLVIKQLNGANKAVWVSIWTDISYDDGERVWTEGIPFLKLWDNTPPWSAGGAPNVCVCGVNDGINGIMIGENGTVAWEGN